MERGELFARGRTAELFIHGEGQLCKLYLPGYPERYVLQELNNARELRALGLPVPQTFGLVRQGGRIGLLYERIEGSTLSDDMDESTLRLFCALHREVLAQTSPDLMEYRDFLREMITAGGCADSALFAQIDALPRGDRVLHGDFHPRNVMLRPDGSPVLLDFLNVCRGPAAFDIARTAFLLRNTPEQRSRYLAAMGADEARLAPYLAVIAACRQYE